MLSVLANRTYRHLFLAQLVALVGTGLATVALGLLAYDIAGGDAGAVLGTALAIKMVAYIGVAPIAGACANRVPRRPLLVSMDAIRAVVAACLPFVDQVWQVYILIFVLQSASAAFTPTFQAALSASDALCARLLAADAMVMAMPMPMHNFCYPSSFKAFLDNVVREGVTYRVRDDGTYEGLLAGRPVLFVTSRGADLQPGSLMAGYDALTPALRAGFGFIGVTDPVFVDAQPMQFADAPAREAALARAEGEVDAVAYAWSRGWGA